MSKIILTSNYNSIKNGNKISISGNKGKDANFKGKSLSELAPKKEFWSIWHDNIGKINEEENTLYYIKEYYNQVLKKIDPENFISSLPNKSILLCYEENNSFCHRHLVAFWLELFLDIKTYEVEEIENYKLKVRKRPEYLKKLLEQVIKENYNMHGFNSIKAAYLFEGSEQLEQRINEMYKEKTLDNYAGELYTLASRLRMDADLEEEKYLNEQNKIKKYNK